MDLAMPRRLDKFIADAGVGTRSQIEQWASAGVICLNGAVTADLRQLVDPLHDAVEVRGKRATLVQPSIYALLHKPQGVVTTLADPRDRRCVAGLLPPQWLGVVGVVGRLDKPTTGALLVTDDGDLSHLLTHPSCQVWKRYVLTVVGEPRDDDPRLAQLRAGVTIGGETTRPAQCGVVPDSARPGRGDARLSDVWVEISEGRFRQVRRMASQVQFKLVHLHRIAIGPLQLGELPEGQIRSLQNAEIDALYGAAGGREAPSVGARASLERRLIDRELDERDAAIVQRYLARVAGGGR